MGAFLTGCPLQVRLSGYSRLQQELGDELKSHPSGGWDYEGLRWRGVESYDHGGGYTSLVPLVLLKRNGEELRCRLREAQLSRPANERRWLAEVTEGWSFELREVRIELYDLGVGVVRGEYVVQVPQSSSVDATRRTVEAMCRLRPDPVTSILSPVAAAYGVLARETVEVFAGAVAKRAEYARKKAWLTPLLEALSPAATTDGPTSHGEAVVVDGNDEWGRLMWLHHLYVFSGAPEASSEDLDGMARAFAPIFSEIVEYQHGIFVAGIDTSVIAVRGRPCGQQERPMKLTGLLWAYYALFMEMDRGLLATLDNDKWNSPESLRALEDDAERTFAIYMRVQEARSRLDSALTDLGGGELTIWTAIAAVQRFAELVAAVEAKVQVLQRVAERRVQQAATARARRTSSILSALTALTIVTVAVAVTGNVFGTPVDAIGSVALRCVIITSALLVATVLYREAHREAANRQWWLRRLGRRLRPPAGRHIEAVVSDSGEADPWEQSIRNREPTRPISEAGSRFRPS